MGKLGYLLSYLPCMCALLLSCVQCSATLWTIAHQASLSMGFSRQEYWSGLLFPLLGDLLDPGIKSTSLASPALAVRFFTISVTWQYIYTCGFPGGSDGKESACNAGDWGLIPEWGRYSREGSGSPLLYSCLKNPKYKRA